MTALEARLLLKNLVKNRDIIRHSIVMESIMLKLAEEAGKKQETWAIVGLLHDLDFPLTIENPTKHGIIAGEILANEGCDALIVNAVKSHSGNLPRTTKLQIAIYSAEAFVELIEQENLTQKDIEEMKFMNSESISKVMECEKIGWTIKNFSDIIINVLKKENFWRS